MSLLYKKWVSICFLIVIFVMGFAVLPQPAHAAVAACPSGTPLLGWAWSSNIGWISFNSANANSGGGTYCVAITSSNDVVGWAWSSNIGWIQFSELAGFPTRGSSRGNAKISGGKLVGWARACSATIKINDNPSAPKEIGNCSTMGDRQDGWDGWLELSGSNHEITYTAGTAGDSIKGYAWGADVLGWVDFNLSTKAVVEPPVEASCSLNSSPVTAKPGTFLLSWNSNPSAVNVTACQGTNFTASTLAGTAEVTPPSGGKTYSLSCTTTKGATIMCQSARSLSPPTAPTPTITASPAPQNEGTINGGTTTTDPCATNPASCSTKGEVTIEVSSAFGTKKNTSGSGTTPTVRVQKGKPFTLSNTAAIDYFDEVDLFASVTSNSDTKIKNIKNSSQQVTQYTQSVTYTIRGLKDRKSFPASITVQAVSSSLEEI